MTFVPMVLDYGVATTLLGARSVKSQADFRWYVTQAICTQCGLTRTFTTNTPELVKKIPGCTTQQVPVR